MDTEGGVWGDHAIFGQKLLNMQCGAGRCTHKSPIVKWANVFKESSKNFTEAKHSLTTMPAGALIQMGS